MGKETIDTNTYGRSDGMRGNFSTNWQISGRELMTPDEVRLLDNKYALLFIRGERPIMDEKFDILKHPNVALTADGSAGAYHHGEATDATADIGFEITNDMSIAELKPYETPFYLLSEEDVEANIKKNGGINFDEETEYCKENHD